MAKSAPRTLKTDVDRLRGRFVRRDTRIAAAVGLLLVVAFVAFVPFRTDSHHIFGERPSKVVAQPAHHIPVLVVPKPSVRGEQAQAVARLAKVGGPVRGGSEAKRLVALTFDDGPGPFTVPIVAKLRALHVRATIFQVGRMLPVFPQGADAERADPDLVIGNHTYSHRPMAALSSEAQQLEIAQTVAAMEDKSEPAPNLFRPPYGSWNPTTRALLRKLGMAMILWNVDSRDYTLPGVPAIVHNVMTEVKSGSIVLMHDAGGNRSQTLAAIPIIVHRLRKRGYKLVTVPELLAQDPPTAAEQAAAARTPVTAP